MISSAALRILVAACAFAQAAGSLAQTPAASPPPAPGVAVAPAATPPAAPPPAAAAQAKQDYVDPSIEVERKKAEDAQRKKREEARLKAERESRCVIRPVLSAAEIAKCR